MTSAALSRTLAEGNPTPQFVGIRAACAARQPSQSSDHPRLHGSMNTSSIRGLPERRVKVRDTWAVPPDSAPSTGELVSITGVGDHLSPATATPTGITELPSTTLTATDPVPAMKNRIEGRVASTHVRGDRADEAAGRDSEKEPRVLVAAYGSLPATSSAPRAKVHVELSKSPPGASS